MASNQTPAQLNDAFAISGVLAFDQEDSLIRANVTLNTGTASICLQGAQIVEWQPANQEPVLFLSEYSNFAPGKAIRGGAPICFPWFGSGISGTQKPSHGFARLQEWTLALVALVKGETLGDELHLTFTLGPSDQSRALGYDDFGASYEIILGADDGRSLVLRLTIANSGSKPLQFEEALHSYFIVGDVEQASVTGLESATFLDKTDAAKPKQAPPGPLQFSKQTDSVFPHNQAAVSIFAGYDKRTFTVTKQNSATTVVWNPFPAGSASLPDLAPYDWRHFLCVEAANTGTDAITLAPGETHTLEARLTSTPS